MKNLLINSIKGECLFIILVTVLAFTYVQVSKDKSIKESISNQVDIKMGYKFLNINGYDIDTIVYYADIENRSIAIKKQLISDINEKYCFRHNLGNFVQIYNFKPMIVECRLYENGIIKAELVSDDWMYNLKDKSTNKINQVIGNSTNYLILENMHLINKNNGNIKFKGFFTRDYIKNNKPTNYTRTTISEKNNYYIHNKKIYQGLNSTHITEIKQIDGMIDIVELPQVAGIPLSNIYVEDMVTSDDGRFLYLLTSYKRRGGQNDLVFYIVNLQFKHIVFSKILEKREYVSNVYLSKKEEVLSIIYRVHNKYVKLYYFSQYEINQNEVIK